LKIFLFNFLMIFEHTVSFRDNTIYQTSCTLFHININCTSLKLDGNLWPESRMALPLGSSLLASILRKCRGHRVRTCMGRSRISIVNDVQEREVHGYGVCRVRWWHWVSPLPGDHLAAQISRVFANESGTATV